ncbi:MAG TPA: FHA domain-containing protein [Planctomycetaceae bacterium]|nr:FHA domain-containing protein [Planctomycetaceae bacterium]
MDAKLSFAGGPWAGQMIQLQRGRLLVGRAEDCDLRMDSEFVSAYHCVVLLDDYTLRIRDLGSKNGTKLNGRRIGSSPTILLHNDLVSIGEMSILVVLSEPTGGTTRALSETVDSKTDSSSTALEQTGIVDGDTLDSKNPAGDSSPGFLPKPADQNANAEPPLTEDKS